MNCENCRDEFAAYLDNLLDAPSRQQVESHLAECESCRNALNNVRGLVRSLEHLATTTPEAFLCPRVMDRIFQEQANELRRLKMRKRLRIFGITGVMATAAALWMFLSMWPTQSARADAEKAAQVMAQGAEASQNPSSVHVNAEMRTLPNDNFSMTDAEYDLIPIEIWRQFGDNPRWRIEKKGRVLVMDGKLTTMLIRPNYVAQIPQPTYGSCDTGCLFSLTEVRDMLTRELNAAIARKWNMKLNNKITASGNKLYVTVEAKSGLPADDYLKNKFFEDSDTTRVYCFDSETKRLEGFEAYLRQPGKEDVLILAIKHIEYDRPIDPAVFTLQLPQQVCLFKEPERLPDNEKYEKMTPKEAAQAFFEACEKHDWDEVGKFFSPLDERVKSHFGSIKLVSLGEPFQSKSYVGIEGKGWFVPYEIKITRTIHGTLRNDNSAKRYVYFEQGEKPDVKRLAELKPLQDNDKYYTMTPNEVVQALFEAYVKKDADAAYKFLEGAVSLENIQKEMTHLNLADFQIKEITPSEEPGCWNITVEIGMPRKHNLAIRSDNPANRFVVDGGI